MLGRLIFLFLLGIIGQSFAQGIYPNLYRPLAKNITEKGYDVDFIGHYYSTAGGYDTDGAEYSLASGSSYNMLEGDMNLTYGYSEKFQLVGGFRFRQNNSTVELNGSSDTTTASGIESYMVGGQYSVKSTQKLWYSFTVEARQTSYNNTNYDSAADVPSGEIVLGDSGNEFTVGMGISMLRTNTHSLSAWGAYRKPPNDLSGEVPYKVNSTWTFSRMAFGLGLEGIYSLNGDEYSNNVAGKPIQSTGTTAMFNSINRQYMAPTAEFYIAFKRWRLGFDVAQVMSGRSTDKWTRFGLNLKFSKLGETKEKRKIGKFKEYLTEATVIKVSPRGKFIQVDVGLSSDVQKGARFDVYQTDFFGGNVLVAEAIAFEVGSGKSILKITKKYKRIKVKKGFIARSFNK